MSKYHFIFLKKCGYIKIILDNIYLFICSGLKDFKEVLEYEKNTSLGLRRLYNALWTIKSSFQNLC